MQITLEQVGKRYRQEWIFRNLNYTFEQGGHYALLGPNGSGKSTLLRTISGHLSPSKGKVQYQNKQGKIISIDQVYQQIAYSGPYIDLIEEFSLLESLEFQQRFKPFIQNLQTEELIQLLGFQHSKNKAIRYFSSGMRQRLKLILSICADVPIVLLDEPTTNLDEESTKWYKTLITKFAADRLLIIASNRPTEYNFCTHQLNILDFK